MQINEKALEAACEAHAPQWAGIDPEIKKYGREQMAVAIRTYFEAATPPDVAELVEQLEAAAKPSEFRRRNPTLSDAAMAFRYNFEAGLLLRAATALNLPAGGGRLWGDPEHERQRMLDHIEALKSENAQLREVLEPFAAVAEHDIGDDETDDDIFWPISNARYSMSGRLRVGHLRAARRAREGGSADG